MKKQEKVLVLYDPDEEYSALMCEYLLGCKGLPWKIVSCTDRKDLDVFCKGLMPDVILSAASMYDGSLDKLSKNKPIILDDTGDVTCSDAVAKYQPAEDTLRGILRIYSGYMSAECMPELLPEGERSKLIGVFSPIRRCYQTTFSVFMGRLLLKKGKVLYLSFEFCEGCEELSSGGKDGTLSDLIYFIKSPGPVFSMRFRSMIKTIAGLDYIPCAVSGTDIADIPATEWKTFLERICVLENYSYVILDLSESVRGIFDVLRLCDCIFTITGNDLIAKRKIESYENVLTLYDYDDVRGKSIKCNVPYVKRVPPFDSELCGGELIDFISTQIGAIV